MGQRIMKKNVTFLKGKYLFSVTDVTLHTGKQLPSRLTNNTRKYVNTAEAMPHGNNHSRSLPNLEYSV